MSGEPRSDFEVTGERVVHAWDRGALVEVSAVSPEGARLTRSVVRHPGAVSIVALCEDSQTVVMVNQFRAAIGHNLLELPAGTRDVAGEDAAATALRELKEETGYSAGRVTKLCEFYNSPGTSDQHHWTYLAEELVAGERQADGEEEALMTVEHVRLVDAMGLIAEGRIRDAKSIVGLLMAMNHLGARS